MPLNGKMIQITMSDGAAIGVYHVEPTGQRRGGLVLLQEIFGVTEHIMEQCDSYAAEGYEVLAPALFDREAPGMQTSYEPADVQKAMKVREMHPFEQSVADVQTCIDRLKDKGPVFMTGYCYGGSVSWAAACRCEGLAAASGFYGGMIPKMVDETPCCPVILHFGKHDKSIPLEGVEAVRARHPNVPVYLYDAGHGFNSDRRADYHAESATLARQRTLALFRAYGG
ncbi:dienelactone hydrolase family protein [Herbaspirillum sp. HC18]|nr:dienelactone hydrolase family protein [Herbaspirillum sp. HC18]